MIRTLWVFLVGGILTMAFAADLWLRAVLRAPSLRSRCLACQVRWARTILRAAGVDVEVSGADTVSREVSHVFVANHESWFDVFALAACLPGDIRFVAKQELERVPFFGTAWRACEHVSIDRGDRSAAIVSLRDAGRAMRESGASIIMFPEGTRSRDGRLQAFKKGAFVLAIQAEAPVVPVGVSGSRAIMPKGSWRIRPGTVHVHVGEAIPVRGLEHEDRDRLAREAREAVGALRIPGKVGGLSEGNRGGEGDVNTSEET